MKQDSQPFQKGYITTLKYRVYLANDQFEIINKTLGSCRFVKNKLLEIANAEYDAYKVGVLTNPDYPKPKVGDYDFTNKLPWLKLSIMQSESNGDADEIRDT